MSKGQSVYVKGKRLGQDYELTSNNNKFIKELFLLSTLPPRGRGTPRNFG